MVPGAILLCISVRSRCLQATSILMSMTANMSHLEQHSGLCEMRDTSQHGFLLLDMQRKGSVLQHAGIVVWRGHHGSGCSCSCCAAASRSDRNRRAYGPYVVAGRREFGRGKEGGFDAEQDAHREARRGIAAAGGWQCEQQGRLAWVVMKEGYPLRCKEGRVVAGQVLVDDGQVNSSPNMIPGGGGRGRRWTRRDECDGDKKDLWRTVCGEYSVRSHSAGNNKPALQRDKAQQLQVWQGVQGSGHEDLADIHQESRLGLRGFHAQAGAKSRVR